VETVELAQVVAAVVLAQLVATVHRLALVV
jgi:hypothetical protein